MIESNEIEENEQELDDQQDPSTDEQDDEQDDAPDDEDEGETEGDAEARGEQGADRKRRGRRKPAEFPADEQSQQALDFVRIILTQMGMNCTVHLRRPKEDEERDIRLEIVGPDSARVIGKRGQVLGALQFLANRALNRPGEERRYITVDAEGYRSRRDNSLTAMAKRLGKQAVSDGKIITFEPMPPRDRRLVHLALAKFDGVITKSEGEGETRRVQIIPVRRSP